MILIEFNLRKEINVGEQEKKTHRTKITKRKSEKKKKKTPLTRKRQISMLDIF